MPQATEQKVQVLRVSAAAASLNGRTDTASASLAPPKPRAPRLEAARPAPVILMKPRRLSSMGQALPILARLLWGRSLLSGIETYRRLTVWGRGCKPVEGAPAPRPMPVRWLCCKTHRPPSRWVQCEGRERAMSDFKGRHFEGEVVLWAVRCCRY